MMNAFTLRSLSAFVAPRVFLGSLLACGALQASYAVDTTTVVEGAGVTITTQDLAADAQRLPAEFRKNALTRTDTVAQMAQSLYVFRALAAEAQRTGLTNDPEIATAARLAADRAVAELLLARAEAATKLDDAALEAYALARYKAEPKAFFAPEEVHVRHILLSKEGDGARAKAEAVLQQLREGADFAKLAREVSIDPGSAPKGGDLGFIAQGKTVKPFEEAAFALTQQGAFGPLVESQFGYHVIQLIARRPAGVRPFNEVREELMRSSAQQLRANARQERVKPLLDAAKFHQDTIEAFSKAPH